MPTFCLPAPVCLPEQLLGIMPPQAWERPPGQWMGILLPLLVSDRVLACR